MLILGRGELVDFGPNFAEAMCQTSWPPDLFVLRVAASGAVGISRSARLFSEISKNWAAEPPDSYSKVLNFIRNTCTRTGLTVSAYLDRRHYPTGTSPDPEHVRRLGIKRHSTLPTWSYTIAPM